MKRDSVGRRVKALLAGCTAVLMGCGAGEMTEELPDATAARAAEPPDAKSDGKATLLSAAPARDRQPPVPPGALRMSQRFSYSLNGVDPTYTEAVVEGVLSNFDAWRIPINVVECGTVSNEDNPPQLIVFGIVLDVLQEDRAAAEALGFREAGSGENTFTVFTTGACSYGLPTITAEQRIHGYAQRVYPELFSRLAEYGTFEQYRYRYYLGAQNYLGLVGDDVYVHNGRDWHFQFVGKVKDFIPTIDGIPGP
jgi:hypothetical protein